MAAEYLIALFDSTSAALLGERLLKSAGVPYKVIPVPRHISSDCGVCVRFAPGDRERVTTLLADRVREIREL